MKKFYRFFITLVTALIVAIACFGCGGQSEEIGRFDETVEFGKRYEKGYNYFVFEKDGTGRYGREGQTGSRYYSSYIPFEWSVGSDERVYLIYGEEVKEENNTANATLKAYDEPLVWGKNFVALNYVDSSDATSVIVNSNTAIFVLAGATLAD